MRLSCPIPWRTSLMSAPSRSQRLAISLMNEIFVARKQLAAYLVISALSGDITRNGWPERRNGACNSRNTLGHFRLANAHHHPVGLHEVVDRTAFLEKLRIARHAGARPCPG